MEPAQKQTHLKFLEGKLDRTEKLYRDGNVAELDSITQQCERDATKQ